MLPSGTVIDARYELSEHVASGGMGVVYRARDHRLDREVAVKLLHRELADDPGFRARFEREAMAAASLSHPGLVSVFDFGTSDHGAYLVMELLSARTLADDLAERGPMPPGEAAALVRAIAEAVGTAHAAGVTHRDLKPSNVLFGPDGRPKVADFGLARSGGSARVTQTGQAVGSVHYLSPEQARGEAAGPGSDVYSLGAILYQLVTGSVPFDAETPVAVALKHVSEEPVPPSQLRPDAEVPAWLEDLILRSLAKDPAGRPVDGAAMAAELALAPADARPERSTTSPIPVVVAGAGGPPDRAATVSDHGEDEDGAERSLAGRLLVIGAVVAIVFALAVVARAVFFPQEVTAGPGTRPIPGPSSTPSPSPLPTLSDTGEAGPSVSPTTPSPSPSPVATTTAPAPTSSGPSATASTTASPSPSPSPSPESTDAAAAQTTTPPPAPTD